MKPAALYAVLALAACTADTTKQDISSPVFDVEDAKEDSPRRPSKGHDLRVGELGEGTFTATRGFIGHAITLVPGRVDLDLSGREDNGDPLDTILYVFGPRRANGTYPSKVLAFNDDFEPGVNLGSHIVFDVPAEGTYLLVATTYDNYVDYPRHTSRADYHLMVKCQNPTFGACGPQVSDVGGACWADEDCVAANGAPLHCEGEITCAPGTECLFVRMGTCAEDYAWMTYAPVQCGSPWSQTEVSEEDAARFPSAELAQVVKYYADFSVQLDEIGLLAAPEPMFTCSACGCPRGNQIVIKAKTPMAAILADHGWTYSSTEPTALSIEPRQCGSNPWQSGSSSDVFAELEEVDTWMAAEGATVTSRGFAWSVEPRAVCAACSCPRGDRLIAFPSDAESHGILSALGFTGIYTN